jgi:hypothetical protein
MDTQVWQMVTAAVRSADRRVPRQGRRPSYSDALIVRLYVWSVWHDRPLCWACDRTHLRGIDLLRRRTRNPATVGTPSGTRRTLGQRQNRRLPCPTSLPKTGVMTMLRAKSSQEQCRLRRKPIIHPQRLITRRPLPDNCLIRRILPLLKTSATLHRKPKAPCGS